MLYFFFNNNLTTYKYYKNIYFINFLQYFFKKFFVNIIGRIYRWLIYKSLFQFKLIYANKKFFFLNQNITIRFKKKKNENMKFFLISNVNLNFLNIQFKKIKKISIFNRKGLKIKKNIILKKKGKISSYITNKI